jgi:hypothetical protein
MIFSSRAQICIRKLCRDKRALHEEPLFPSPFFLTAAPPRPDRTSFCGDVPLTVPGVFEAILSITGRPPEGAFRSSRAQARQYRLLAVPEHKVSKWNLQM